MARLDKHDTKNFGRYGFCGHVSINRYCTRVANGDDGLCTYHRNRLEARKRTLAERDGLAV